MPALPPVTRKTLPSAAGGRWTSQGGTGDADDMAAALLLLAFSVFRARVPAAADMTADGSPTDRRQPAAAVVRPPRPRP
jgi:hypothetical protein